MREELLLDVSHRQVVFTIPKMLRLFFRFNLKRLFFDETAGKVRYQYSRHGSQQELMDYLEFIARVTSHIPDKGQVMIRYYGLYSNAHRGKLRKIEEKANSFLILEQEEAFVPSKGWAEMIRKVYELDPSSPAHFKLNRSLPNRQTHVNHME
jgi:hypothetical protein